MAAPKRPKWGFILLGVVLVVLILYLAFCTRKPEKHGPPPPVPVSAAKVTLQDVPVSVNALGAAQAWQGVLIRTQVNGKLLRFNAAEGGQIAAGAVIAEVDPAPYLAVLTQAQGALARDRALLAEAKVDLARFQTLAAQDSIARQQVDTQAALVKQDEGTVQIDEGTVAAAKVNVNYTRIVSPVTGRVGVRLVDPGNIVSTTDTTGIVSVNQIDPIAVTFTVPQGDFQKLMTASNGFTTPLVTQALSQDTGEPLGTGELSIADNHVDQTTGTVALKARFPNPAKHLWPGQFVNVKLTLQTLAQVPTIPASAVNQGPNGAFAYVIGPDKKVTARPIVVQTTQDTTAVIKSGLAAGEMVVTDGQMSLSPGKVVNVRPPAGQQASAKKPGA